MKQSIYSTNGGLTLENKLVLEIVAYNYTGLNLELCKHFSDWNRVSSPHYTIFTIPLDLDGFTTEMLQSLKRQCRDGYIVHWKCGDYTENNTKLEEPVTAQEA
jgi:hypothetical protein